MTLVIVGVNKNSSNHAYSIFAVSDSNITDKSNGRVLVKGFKKVLQIPIAIRGVNILDDYDGGYFHSYSGYITKLNCLLAFAGGTLVAQHMINSISNHLSDIRPIYDYKNQTHDLAMPCQHNLFLIENSYYSNDILTDRQIIDSLTAEKISKIIEHSINAVLSQAKRQNEISIREVFHSMETSFIFGMHCPKIKKYQIYKYNTIKNMIFDEEANCELQELIVRKTIINEDEVAVIGMGISDQEEATAYLKQHLNNKTPKYNSTAKAMFSFLSKKIDSQNEKKDKTANYIGKPCFLYELEMDLLSLKARQE